MQDTAYIDINQNRPKKVTTFDYCLDYVISLS